MGEMETEADKETLFQSVWFVEDLNGKVGQLANEPLTSRSERNYMTDRQSETSINSMGR